MNFALSVMSPIESFKSSHIHEWLIKSYHLAGEQSHYAIHIVLDGYARVSDTFLLALADGWQVLQKKVERPEWTRREMGVLHFGQGSPSLP